MPEQTLRSLFIDNLENKIVLPDFQRSFEWEPTKQKSFLASTLIDLSIGALLFLKGNKGDFRSKVLGVNGGNNISPKDECLYLLDGQQRLTSLRAFFTDFFDSKTDTWEETWASLYSNLRYRWLISLKPINNSDDFFGYNSLHFVDRSKDVEPSTIMPYISFVQINKDQKDIWCHPNYTPKDENGIALEPGLKRYKVITSAADECNVPLYTLFSGDLHEDVIDAIASNRLEQIKQIIKTADVNQRKRLVVSYLSPVFGRISSDIAQYSDDTDFADVYRDKWADLRARWSTAVLNYFTSILKNTVNIMVLEKNQVARAIAIFTAINEGGQKLSPFDLIVAKAAVDKSIPTLPDRIRQYVNQNMIISENWAPISHSIPDWTCGQMGCIEDDKRINRDFQDSFLNLLSAFVHTNFIDAPQSFADNLKDDYFKAQKQLEMTTDQINRYTDLTLKSLIRAHAFLQFYCGIVSGTDLPYRLMLLPIAFVLADDNAWCTKSTFMKLRFWYWTSLFSGTYRESQNYQSHKDSKLLYRWIVQKSISGEDLASIKMRQGKMFGSTDYSDESTLINSNNTPAPRAMQLAILQFVLSTQPVDFLPKNQFDEYHLCAWNSAKYQNRGIEDFAQKIETNGSRSKYRINLKLQDHHIVPLGSATRIGESSKAIRKLKGHPINSPLNRTYISAEANRMIQDDDPNKYYSEVFPVALAFHMTPDISDEIKRKLSGSEDEKRAACVAILKQRFKKIKDELSKELSGLAD